MLDLMHWTGSIIGVVGFFMLTSACRRVRWHGSLWSLLGCSALIPWAVLVGAYGLIVLWLPIAACSARGMRTNSAAGRWEILRDYP